MDRREFFQRSGVLAAGAFLASGVGAAAQETAYKRLPLAVQLGKLPKDVPDSEKFRIAKEAGFDGVEAYPMADLDAARRQAEQAREAGVPIHSVTYGGWGAPMSSPDPDVIAKGKAEIENALRTSHAMGCDTMLLVPAVVNENVGYAEAWKNSQKNIREMIPLAEELEVIIAVENVWNKFLLSPLEFATYVDEFESPWVRAYFDVGNVVIFGYPEDWIRTLNHRIQRVHVKEFKREGSVWPKLPYEGDVNWPAVRQALHEVGYEGFITEEYPGGDVEWLHELVRRMRLHAEGAASA
jgi:L-ribulose-5-phosphate 3-epimerase